MSTQNTPITCQVQVSDETHVVALCGSLCDDGIDTTRSFLCDIIDGGATQIAIDMQGVEYVSSSGIGMLVSILKRCHQADIEFALCSPTTDIHELFTLTRLDQVFTIAPDLESWKSSI